MDTIFVEKVSLQWLDDETLQKVHTNIQKKKTYLRMQIDVTDSANQYQKSMGNINRQRSFVGSINMANVSQSQYRETLFNLQQRIFDQNFTYNPVLTTFKLQFFQTCSESLQKHDLENLTVV